MLIDYIAINQEVRGKVMDARIVRGMLTGSDHYAVLARLRVKVGWKFRGVAKEKS